MPTSHHVRKTTVELTERQLRVLLRLCRKALGIKQKQLLSNIGFTPEPGHKNSNVVAIEGYNVLIRTLERAEKNLGETQQPVRNPAKVSEEAPNRGPDRKGKQ